MSMNKKEYLDSICSKCKAFCNNERKADREHKCPKLKDVAIAWDSAIESAIEYLEENIFTKYDYDWEHPKEDGIQGVFSNKWELINDFRNKLS